MLSLLDATEQLLIKLQLNYACGNSGWNVEIFSHVRWHFECTAAGEAAWGTAFSFFYFFTFIWYSRTKPPPFKRRSLKENKIICQTFVNTN